MLEVLQERVVGLYLRRYSCDMGSMHVRTQVYRHNEGICGAVVWPLQYNNGDTVDAILAAVQRVLVRKYVCTYVVRRQ